MSSIFLAREKCYGFFFENFSSCLQPNLGVIEVGIWHFGGKSNFLTPLDQVKVSLLYKVLTGRDKRHVACCISSCSMEIGVFNFFGQAKMLRIFFEKNIFLDVFAGVTAKFRRV